MSNQSQDRHSTELDAIGNALRQAESAVVVDEADLARRREALLGWMTDRIKADPEPPADGAKTEASTPRGMNTELDALAIVAATALVHLLATEDWKWACAAIGGLCRRVDPAWADTVHAELEASRFEVLEAREAGHEEAVQDLIAEWDGRLRRLLSASPAAAAELHHLLKAWKSATEAAPHQTSIELHQSAPGSVQMYQGEASGVCGLAGR
jgi:hypothetical protein